MAISNFVVASLMGAMSLSSVAVASRDLQQSDRFCRTFPDNHLCTGETSGDTTSSDSSGSSDSSSSGGSSSSSGSSSSGTSFSFGSSATCYAYASSGGSSGGGTVAEAVAAAAAYTCTGDGAATATAAAEATATLFAKAVAEASVECVANGDASFYANAKAFAKTTAEDWLVAYAEAFADASVCNTCAATVESWGYVEKNVFLEAIASAEAQLEGYTDASSIREFSGYARDYESTVKEAVVTAYAEAIANAATYNDGAECFAWVNSNGCVYTPDHPDPEFCEGFECVASAVSESFITEIDAVSTAGAGAAAIACGPDSFAVAETTVIAKALAEATAIAISEMYVSCKAEEGAYTCANADTNISASAKAVAKAFAESWAFALECQEKCVVSVETATETFGEILATAASEAYASVCAAGGEQWTVDDIVVDIELKLLEAVAEAAAFALTSVDEQGGAVCIAATFAGTSVTPA